MTILKKLIISLQVNIAFLTKLGLSPQFDNNKYNSGSSEHHITLFLPECINGILICLWLACLGGEEKGDCCTY